MPIDWTGGRAGSRHTTATLEKKLSQPRRSCGSSWALAALLAVATAGVHASPHRLKTTRAEFQRQHPCPANSKARGACPGYVVDHVKPLCAGGADDPSNMQWQTVADAKAKDKLERQQCRRK